MPDVWAFWPVAIGIAVLAAVLVFLSVRRACRLGLAVFTALLAVLGAIWLLGLNLVESGWNDVDGFIDCHSYCNRWHLLGALLWAGPPLVAILVTVAFVASLLRFRRPPVR